MVCSIFLIKLQSFPFRFHDLKWAHLNLNPSIYQSAFKMHLRLSRPSLWSRWSEPPPRPAWTTGASWQALTSSPLNPACGLRGPTGYGCCQLLYRSSCHPPRGSLWLPPPLNTALLAGVVLPPDTSRVSGRLASLSPAELPPHHTINHSSPRLI